MSRPLTRDDLDKMRCSDPNCTKPHTEPLDMLPGCHPLWGSRVTYDRTTGTLTLSCMRCGHPLGTIAVKEADGVQIVH